ncbi:hypothetical protein EFV37_15310 [Mesorhizobium loti]|uniref:Uncharacterized protein n=1 Tax=Mesorhizobium jarvisii TaxID=1777867 RepID=A0A6M7TFL1_9HYPH|nr:hypothetical protein A9K72_27700 [Mesorhizobium loti]QKC63512.1 hypothetical protein EB229_15305 [Mesorhizobium jarvisii]QKD09424.1 hypothetical protein EFV37_15310 [Mesorhizobium loti]RJT29775.1 hypothetical protein D3242_28110 [Mesorhizobium jarvisii]
MIHRKCRPRRQPPWIQNAIELQLVEPLIAAIAMSASSLIVIANAMRLHTVAEAAPEAVTARRRTDVIHAARP